MKVISQIVTWLIVLVAAPLLSLGASGSTAKKIGVGLYGSNGHQLNPAKLASHPQAQLVAVAGLKQTSLPAGVKRHATLDELIRDPAVELISLCSPRRADQARDAIRCLDAGKHVYAEKPCALTEGELDQILAAARRSGKEFHEMAGTAFAANYAAMRQLVREGAVGDVIQVLVQKSYRYGASRPQDEAIDGGMFLQAGVHAARMVEHVGGVRIKTITGWETSFGKPENEKGEGKIAAAAQIGLENGGIATLIINYLNPGHPQLPHGNETLRIFGTKGFIESVDGGTRTRLVTKDQTTEPLPPVKSADYFDYFAAHVTTGVAMPLTLEEELHPLQMLIRAKEQLRSAPAAARAAALSQPTR
ncbi:MAG: Gfo/Idh/MocA family oxidoreductase [Opitutaceae bacterium]|nr:Gfo/Idh/MocA family oxidoreductase [Opitutaceae bacterium]